MCTYNIIMSSLLMSVCHHKLFSQFLNYFLMFQCNGHVELNEVLCSLACNNR